MKRSWVPVLTGGFVLAALMLPAVADTWTTGPARNFNVRSITVDDIVGNVSVAVRDNGPITVQVSGLKHHVDAVSVGQDDGKVEVSGENFHDVWDWRHWFDFSEQSNNTGDLSVKVTVPRGSEVHIEDLVGDAQVGDTMGPFHLGAVSTHSTIGRVGDAHISLAGSGDVRMADISGDLHAETAGSGKIVTGNVKSVHADVAGAGSINTGHVDGDLKLDIAGSGDFAATSLNGGLHVDIAGSGSVRIAQGTADPFHVDILGSGNIYFGGTAVDPHVDGVGSGSVSLHAMKGQLHNDGMANVRVGS